jgi:septal ring factor EnvC (AmiA/AmiB activator)
MIEAPHQISQTNDEGALQEEERQPARTPLAIRAACFVLAVIAIGLGSRVLQLNSDVANANSQLTQSVSETDRVKADMEKASAQVTDLQQQLDKAKGLRTDLQAQVDKAQAQQSALQSQLDKARADLQAQIDKSRTQASAMQAEISRAGDGSAELRRELVQVRAQADDLKSQLSASQAEVTRLQPLAQRAHILPVAASFEKSFWGGKYTMHVRNMNPEPLNVTVSVAGQDKVPAKSAVIAVGETYNLGGLAAGTSVVIQGEGYDPLTVTAK